MDQQTTQPRRTPARQKRRPFTARCVVCRFHVSALSIGATIDALREHYEYQLDRAEHRGNRKVTSATT